MSQHSLEWFRTACGSTGPFRVQVLRQDGSVDARYLFDQPFILIGREGRNDLALDDASVSRRHALVQVIAGRTFFVDLGSRTGVSCHGEQRFSGWLDPTLPLQIGSFAVQVELDQQENGCSPDDPVGDWDPIDRVPNGSPISPGVTLELSKGQSQQAQLRLNQALTFVGGSAACRVQLADASVSRFHAALLHTSLGLWAVDLLGREGMQVNGQRVRWSRLADGDLLQVGDFAIRAAFDRPDGLAPSGGADLLPSRTALVTRASPRALVPGRALEHAGLQDVLLPVLNQFSLMQQQMFDQFQQTMLMMVQMFGTLHRDQMDLLREELHQLHAVTRELQSLQMEFAWQPAFSIGPGPDPVSPPRTESARPPGDPAQKSESAPASKVPPLAGAPDGHTDPAIHAWVSQRIAQLQQERQGRWQKILSFVMGK
jgi:pSer/pThr/pTyr-binding forkhead associated (FHA) protein